MSSVAHAATRISDTLRRFPRRDMFIESSCWNSAEYCTQCHADPSSCGKVARGRMTGT